MTSTGDRPEICPLRGKHLDNWARELNQLEHKYYMQTFFRKEYLKDCLKELNLNLGGFLIQHSSHGLR